MGFVIGQQPIGLVLLVLSVWQGVSDTSCPPVCEIYCELRNVLDAAAYYCDASCPPVCKEPIAVPPTTKLDAMCCLDGYAFGLVQGGTVKMCIGPTDDVATPFACNRPLTSDSCNRCGQPCMIEGDIAGLCNLEGQCSWDYDAVEKSCPLGHCPPVCPIACEFGNVMDDAGCPTCSCKEPTPTDTSCPPVCDIYCELGNVVDAAGCPTCTCEPVCPPVCPIACEFGNVMDDAGCPTCSCKELTAWTVQGSLVLEVADASRVVSSSTLHRVFARVVAKLAGVGKSSVQITVSALRRLTQFLASSDVPRSLQQAQVLVAFTCESTSQLRSEQMAHDLSGASSDAVKAEIDKELVALGLNHVIGVVSMEAQLKVVHQPVTERAGSHTSVMVACLVSISGGLSVFCAAALCLWACRRSSSKSDTKVVVIEKVLSPTALDANSGCVEDKPVILAGNTKYSNDEPCDDVSTDVSSSPSSSSDQSVASIKA